MGDISNHLSRYEMECSCGCGFSACDAELVRVLEDCMDYFEAREGRRLTLVITGPNRCQTKNNSLKGAAKNSAHVKGLAADFRINGVEPDDVTEYLMAKYPSQYGIGRYIGRTHLDVLPGRARRWDFR